MPTVLMIDGWRFFFFSNEGGEPVHIHCRKGDSEAKFWLDAEGFDVIDAYVYGMSASDRRNVRRIIFEHFDCILKAWGEFQESRNG